MTGEDSERSANEAGMSMLRRTLLAHDSSKPYEQFEGVDTQANQYLEAFHDSFMVALNEHGVYVGTGAAEKASSEARARADEQGVLEPLFDKAPYGIESNSDLQFIPRRLSEARGVYFARVAAALIRHPEDKDEHASYVGMLGEQLLVQHEETYDNGSKVAIGALKSNQSIDDELALLQRIVDSGEAGDLDQLELGCLKFIIRSAKRSHDFLKDFAIEKNVEAVEDRIIKRRSQLRPKRTLRRVGALASAGIALGSFYMISQVQGSEPSPSVSSALLSDSLDLRAGIRLQDPTDGDLEIEGVLDEVIQESQETILDMPEDQMTSNDRDAIDAKEEIDRLTLDYIKLVNSGDVEKSLETYDQIYSKLDDLVIELSTKPDELGINLIIGIIVAGYGSFAAILMLGASKNGGKRDPLLKNTLPQVKEGSIALPYDVHQTDIAVHAYNKVNSTKPRYY
jgi:hypothetical protein